MGCCSSKNDPASTTVHSVSQTYQNDLQHSQKLVALAPLRSEQPNKENAAIKTNSVENNEKIKERDEDKEALPKKKKEVFVIQHRKSNDKRGPDSDRSASNSSDPIREPESSRKEGNLMGHIRRYSGSKRSFDFDSENGELIEVDYDERRQSRGSHSHRRSREREQTPQQHWSGSRERSLSNGRRVSRSPGKRSEIPISSNSNSNSNSNGSGYAKPAKLVSGSNVKRVLVRRNVGSPARDQSPGMNGNGGQQVVSLSRNGSRKAEQSPFRRTPLNEEPVVDVKQPVNFGFQENKLSDIRNVKAYSLGTHRRTSSRGAETSYCRLTEHQTQQIEQMTNNKREQLDPNDYDVMVTLAVVSSTDTALKLPQTLMRRRYGRRSRDLDTNVEALLATDPATNYNSLLLQDIQNFHQKISSNSNAKCCNNAGSSNIDSRTRPFTLPACVSNARSSLKQ